MNEYLSLTYLVGAVLVPPASLILLALVGLLLLKRRRALGLTLSVGSLLLLLVLSLPVVALLMSLGSVLAAVALLIGNRRSREL